MRVLLTGGYGCIGAWIVHNLLERGDEVWIYDLKEDPRRLRLIMSEDQVRRARFLAGDVTDLPALRSAIEGQHISHVIHLAGLQVPVCRADPLLGAKVNVLGTLAVFEAVRRAQRQVQRLVYASSAAVFGPPEAYGSGPLSDDVPLAPSTHYGVFKCCNEGNARVYFQDHGLSSVGLRPWTVYGVGRDFGMTSEPTKAIKALALGRRHVVDLPTFHRALCEVEPAAERLITFGERQIAIAYDLNDAALERDFGPLPRTPLAEGIRRTLQQFRGLQEEGRLDAADLDS
jgi:nucleoside-diphosphate-sugar epimerase